MAAQRRPAEANEELQRAIVEEEKAYRAWQEAGERLSQLATSVCLNQ